MNGYELARAIRDHEQQSHRPPCTVLGFTANAQPEERQRCKQAGMDDCLFKPLTLTALNQWVAGIVPTDRAPAFSLKGLHLLTGGNPAMDLRLLTELLTSNRLDRQAMQALSRTNDPQLFLDMAHKIKGAARIVQATRLIDSCEVLEQACHEVFHHDKVAECREAVERAMLELEQALQQQIGQNDESRMMEP
jgi:two-component system sensor histidine kinase EvgS